MKKLLLTWVILFLAIGLGWAQTENTWVQNFTLEEDCYFAVFALNGPATVQTWEEPTVQIVYTLRTKNANETVNNHQIEMKFYEEERVMIFEVPNEEKEDLINAKMVEDFLEVQIFVPNDIKYHIVPTNLHPLM
ncbi:MAG: Unknown protein [uncultured Aureispira sp.]|uniref:Uncharacterized protein n=1 Tax=uncultured Aureispira sp. TaxID=1331704 RepID=A0A6S6S485_9BACT|nr:MAG: Unknown protein [uncultured Aureispira sp.]